MLFALTKPAKTKDRTFTNIGDLLDWYNEYGDKSSSGVSVSPLRAMQQSTVYTCVRILSECIAQLPIELQRIRADRFETITSHPALDVLHHPNEWQTPHEMLQLIVTHIELSGNAYMFKNYDGGGRVKELLPLCNNVSPNRFDDWSLVYTVSTDRGEIAGQFTSDEILHFRNLSYDGFIGMSTISMQRDAVGLAIQAEKHGARVFKNGAQFGRVLEFPAPLTDEQWSDYKARLSAYEGAENAHKTMVLDGGAKLNSSTFMTNEDAEFLETRRFQRQEIAAIYGIPMFLLNDTEKNTTWGTGLEQMTKAFKAWTIGPRLNRITQSLEKHLLTPREQNNYRFVFDMSQFDLGDFKDQMEGLSKAIDTGLLNPNEGRQRINRNPREGGDAYRHPMNMTIEGEDDAATDTE